MTIPFQGERASLNGSSPTPRYRLYSAAELDDLPPAQWIIHERIPRNGLVGLIGAKGTMKTFVALDLALHVTTGLEWHDRDVRAGDVVYVYAEGPFGAKARVDAWCAYQQYATKIEYQRKHLRIWFLPSRIPINVAGDVAALLVAIRQLEIEPVLVIIDTLNQNLDGDEDGKGMGGFVAGCSHIRDALSCTVMPVHHTPIGVDERARGHSAFDGAIDTRLIVTRDADRITLACTHQRNAQDGWSVAYEALNIAGSVALKPTGPTGGKLSGKRRELLALGHRLGPSTYSALFRESDIKKTSFKDALNWLEDNAYMRNDKKKYVVTDAGAMALGQSGPEEGRC
jgi:hypothetical protein